MDHGGMQVSALKEWLDTTQIKPSFVYCIPCHHNPPSVCLERARFEQLLALARQHDFIIVFDDPYSLLPYSASASAAPSVLVAAMSLVKATPEEGCHRIIILGSFSK